MNGNTPNNQPEIETEPLINTQYNGGQSVVPTVPTPPQQKFNKKALIIISALLMIGIGVAVFYGINKTEAPQPTVQPTSKPQLSISNLPKQQSRQFSNENFTTGYVKYDPAKLEKIETTLPDLESVLPASSDINDRQVLFMQDQASNPRVLIMYDFSDKMTYRISQSSGAGTYHRPAIMSDHFVVFAETTHLDPLNSTTKVKLVNLKTGNSSEITENKSSDFPASLCCFVSPDGLRLAIPQQDEFLVYQVTENGFDSVSFLANVNVFSDVEGSDNDDYAAGQRNYGYPTAVWLDGNRLMYAKSHPTRWTIDGSGSHVHQAKNGLAIMDLSTGESKDVARTNDASIKWFTVDNNALIYSNLHPDLEGLTIYKVDDFTDSNSQPLPLATAKDYQSRLLYDTASKKLYIQPSGGDIEQTTTVMQELNIESGEIVSKRIGKYDHPQLEGVIGPNQLIVNNGLANVNDYNIYNVILGTTEQIARYP